MYRSINVDLRMKEEGLSDTLILSSSQLVASAVASALVEGETDFLGGRGALTASREGSRVDGPGSSP